MKDADVGVNGMVEYHINNDLAERVFKIDSTTGAIELLRHLDYETNSGYTFDVTVIINIMFLGKFKDSKSKKITRIMSK